MSRYTSAFTRGYSDFKGLSLGGKTGALEEAYATHSFGQNHLLPGASTPEAQVHDVLLGALGAVRGDGSRYWGSTEQDGRLRSATKSVESILNDAELRSTFSTSKRGYELLKGMEDALSNHHYLNTKLRLQPDSTVAEEYQIFKDKVTELKGEYRNQVIQKRRDSVARRGQEASAGPVTEEQPVTPVFAGTAENKPHLLYLNQGKHTTHAVLDDGNGKYLGVMWPTMGRKSLKAFSDYDGAVGDVPSIPAVLEHLQQPTSSNGSKPASLEELSRVADAAGVATAYTPENVVGKHKPWYRPVSKALLGLFSVYAALNIAACGQQAVKEKPMPEKPAVTEIVKQPEINPCRYDSEGKIITVAMPCDEKESKFAPAIITYQDGKTTKDTRSGTEEWDCGTYTVQFSKQKAWDTPALREYLNPKTQQVEKYGWKEQVRVFQDNKLIGIMERDYSESGLEKKLDFDVKPGEKTKVEHLVLRHNMPVQEPCEQCGIECGNEYSISASTVKRVTCQAFEAPPQEVTPPLVVTPPGEITPPVTITPPGQVTPPGEEITIEETTWKTEVPGCYEIARNKGCDKYFKDGFLRDDALNIFRRGKSYKPGLEKILNEGIVANQYENLKQGVNRTIPEMFVMPYKEIKNASAADADPFFDTFNREGRLILEDVRPRAERGALYGLCLVGTRNGDNVIEITSDRRAYGQHLNTVGIWDPDSKKYQAFDVVYNGKGPAVAIDATVWDQMNQSQRTAWVKKHVKPEYNVGVLAIRDTRDNRKVDRILKYIYGFCFFGPSLFGFVSPPELPGNGIGEAPVSEGGPPGHGGGPGQHGGCP